MRKLCLMLSFIFLLHISVFSVNADESRNIPIELEEELFVLRSLDIISLDEDGRLNLNEEITRAEFTVLLGRSLGIYEVSSNYEQRFYDLPKEHWAASYILSISDMGLISGYSDGRFRPDEPITYTEAATILVKMLGYEILANRWGGYPSGYESAALHIGLNDNLPFNDIEHITRGETVILIYNALMADRIGKTFNNNLELKVGNTLFKDRLEQLGLYYMEGVINTILGVSIVGRETKRYNLIQIDDYDYYLDKMYGITNPDEWIGRFVRFFVDEEGYIRTMQVRSDSNKIVKIDADMIESSRLNSVTYYLDKEESSKDKINFSEDCRVLYNGEIVEYITDELFMIPNGNLIALDNNGDKEYEVLFLNVYDSFIIERVNYNDKIIFIKDKLINNRPYIKMDDSDKDFIGTIQDLNGASLRFEDIKAGDTITVSQSMDANRVSIIVLNQTVSGVVTEIDADSANIIIDDEEYHLAKNMDGSISVDISEITLGIKNSFYIDKMGDIFAINEDESLTETYAYIVDYAISRGLSENSQVKLLFGGCYKIIEDESKDPDSSERFYKEIINQGVKIYPISQNVRVDNKTFKANELPEVCKKNQVVTVKTNKKGEITDIKRAVPHGDSNRKRTYDYKTDTFGGSNGGAFFVNDKTIFFIIPTDISNEDNFYSKYKLTEGMENPVIQGWNFSQETKFADVAVVNADVYYDSFENITLDTPITIIESITKKLNRDGEPVYNIKGWRNGKRIDMFCRNSSYIANRVKNLRTGDLIRFAEDGAGRIADIEEVYNLSKIPSVFHKDYRGEKEQIFGYIYEIELNTLKDTSTSRSDIISVTLNGNDSFEYIIPDVYNKASCYYFDPGKKTVQKISLDEVNSMQNTDILTANKAYIFSNYGTVQVVVVVK